MKKKILLNVFLFFLSVLSASASSSASLASELTAAYRSGFYPGVVRYAEEILADDPSSVFAGRALAYEGESLYRMGRKSEAENALARAAAVSGSNNEVLAVCAYWTGRIQFDEGQYEKASPAFYECARRSMYSDESKNSQPAAENAFYAPAILYGARTYRRLGDDKNAVPLFEYVVSHGTSYTVSDYEDSVLELLSAYNKTGSYQKTEQLALQFQKIKSDGTSVLTKSGAAAILLYLGDAQFSLGKYKDSYSSYTTVMTEGTPSLAVTALQRAYTVSSEHKNEVGAEPGSVIARAENQFADYPELVAEFRTRLGVDAFKNGDYTEASSYFDQAAAHASRANLQLAALYRAEMIIKKASQPQLADAAAKADSVIVAASLSTSLVSSDSLYTIYSAARARFAGLAGDWAACRTFADSALFPVPPAVPLEYEASEAARYWSALASYQTGDYDGCIKTLSPLHPEEAGAKQKLSDDDISVRILYARALAKTGRLSEADAVFFSLGEAGGLANEGRIDYAKTLLISGHLISAGSQSSKASGGEALYLNALALFNRRQWADAESGFTKSIASSGVSVQYKQFAQFYLGYAQYRQGKYEQAYSSLLKFQSDNPMHQLAFAARMTAARAAVQNENYSQAFPLADEAIRTAPSEQSKQEAVLLSAGIYADAKKYDDALSKLASYTQLHTDFGIQCRSQTAQIYVQKQDYKSADAVYASIASEKSQNQLVEESSYKRGELAYTTERYVDAIPLFESYRSSYPQGKFYDAALYFTADSLVRTGSNDRAILMYTQLIKSSSESTYRYGAEKNLVTLYEAAGDYDNALSLAQSVLGEYGEQARIDGIADKMKELKSLGKGEDSQIVRKRAEYEAAGGNRTAKGRALGTELAELYASSPSSQKQALSFAEQLFAEQKKNIADESSFAARTAMILGSQYRMQNGNKTAANYYLSAAEYFRMNSDSGNAARALYGAVESFDAAGLYGDSKETAKTLAKLYPDSRQSQAAQALVNK